MGYFCIFVCSYLTCRIIIRTPSSCSLAPSFLIHSTKEVWAMGRAMSRMLCSIIPLYSQSISHIKLQELGSPVQGDTVWHLGPLIARTILEFFGPFSNSTLFPPIMNSSPSYPNWDR